LLLGFLFVGFLRFGGARKAFNQLARAYDLTTKTISNYQEVIRRILICSEENDENKPVAMFLESQRQSDLSLLIAATEIRAKIYQLNQKIIDANKRKYLREKGPKATDEASVEEDALGEDNAQKRGL
jgi:hypothetical protein